MQAIICQPALNDLNKRIRVICPDAPLAPGLETRGFFEVVILTGRQAEEYDHVKEEGD